MPTILVVDDEPRIVKLARDYLEKDGYQVISAQDGNHALLLARSEPVDLIVLDLMLPGLNGWEVCRALRRESNVPIIMLTARAEESDQIVGLELGADDYITKPFSPRALVARVRAVLRRVNQPEPQNALLVVGDLQIDMKGHRVSLAGTPLHLTPNEFRLLSVFAQHPRQTLTREQLLDQLHGISLPGFDRSIDSHIKNLRRKLEPDPANPRYIETVYGIGYRFNG
ncbi:MAG TPA: response regulator transcription factor [Anaerolineales bacterium]|nr:response regulator transcription factor [Anaerolineales bacterium]